MSKSRESALHDPSAWDKCEALYLVRARNNFQCPVAFAFQCGADWWGRLTDHVRLGRTIQRSGDLKVFLIAIPAR